MGYIRELISFRLTTADQTGGEVQAGKLACMDEHHHLAAWAQAWGKETSPIRLIRLIRLIRGRNLPILWRTTLQAEAPLWAIPRALPPVTHGSALQAPERM